MNGKSTGILLAAAGVILAFIWFVDRPIRLERLRQADHSILPGFDPAAINYIEVKPRGTNEIHVECANPASNFFLLTSASQIITTFNQIGTNLSRLRVAK